MRGDEVLHPTSECCSMCKCRLSWQGIQSSVRGSILSGAFTACVPWDVGLLAHVWCALHCRWPRCWQGTQSSSRASPRSSPTRRPSCSWTTAPEALLTRSKASRSGSHHSLCELAEEVSVCLAPRKDQPRETAFLWLTSAAEDIGF